MKEIITKIQQNRINKFPTFLQTIIIEDIQETIENRIKTLESYIKTHKPS